ncbi:AAA family ATPase [Tenacibaculum singaporense]|uniref:AAA family ATPase n=1 Tax=Tenacibaculum singaporense TaxID=2358479 RepID=A0A3Q8RQE1_9FLAO|nr:AAA family ATPase [Tenacibaculum singaporense]AZJ36873.1 AAA family ATPase [Tenacibaculum singaporense]
MHLEPSKRDAVKLRIGLSGASGFGKTYSALLLAYGLTKNWNKIAVIDTENKSASLYSHLGNFQVINLDAPFSPSRYIEAIKLCESNKNIDVIILDSISHEWNGSGGCLDIHNKLGARFQDWNKVTKLHQAFVDAILQSSCHIITTTRRKTHYSLDIKPNGKAKVTKLGTKEITREGWEYELTVNFELINQENKAVISKDRTDLFSTRNEFVITEEVGEKLAQWCVSRPLRLEEVIQQISKAKSISELTAIYKSNPKHQETLLPAFKKRKEKLDEVAVNK